MASNRRRQVFRNLLAAGSGGMPLETGKFRKLVSEASKRVLERPAKKAIPGYLMGERPQSNLRRVLQSGAEYPLLFESGARMEARWIQGEQPLIDAPTATKTELQPFRVAVFPGESEAGIRGFGLVKELLFPLNLDRDALKDLRRSVGYFGLAVHPVRGLGMVKKSAGVIWTWQQRGIPLLENFFQRRYRNWDFELLYHVEQTLRKAGIGFIAVSQSALTNEKQRKTPINKKLEKRGYRLRILYSPFFGLRFPGESADRYFWVKKL